MSEVVWRRSMVPNRETPPRELTWEYYGESLKVAQTKALDFNEREAELPDRRAFRQMSRAAMMLSVLGMEAKSHLIPVLERDPFKVGIYFAVENGPVDFESSYKMRDIKAENFASEYKKNRGPTMYLKQLPNLAAAHLGIFLGVFGPMSVYTDSEYGAIHALEQAELDLEAGRIELALVGGSFSFENPLTLARNEKLGPPGKILAEGAGLMLLKKSAQRTDWANESYGFMPEYFGIADQIIELNERGTGYAN